MSIEPKNFILSRHESIEISISKGLFLYYKGSESSVVGAVFECNSAPLNLKENSLKAVFTSTLETLIAEAGSTPQELKLVGEGTMLKMARELLQSRFVGVKPKLVERNDAFTLRSSQRGNLLGLSKPALLSHKLIKPQQIDNRTKVLIVDDSKPIRDLLEKVLSKDSDIEIVGKVGSPKEARAFLANTRPDVITLDIHMPEMNGVDFLKEILPQHPFPVIMISSTSMQEGPLVLEALKSGAVDYIQKPSFDQLHIVGPIIIEKVKQARKAKVKVFSKEKITVSRFKVKATDHLVAIGSSTGGTCAIEKIFSFLPESIPPIVITQHIPAVFSKAFADRLNQSCPFLVKEAQEGDPIIPNQVLIAPGGLQMGVVRTKDDGLRVRLKDSEPVNRFKPSVDYLFDSILASRPEKLISILLTGMGRDGAQAMKRLHDGGYKTVAQDEKSCVVFGMPRAAIELGAASLVLNLEEIAGEIIEPVHKLKLVA